jgi:uncharacterized protein (TIGR02266 family)
MMSEVDSQQPERPVADKRKNLRSPLLILKVKIDDGDKVFFGYAKNISKSGLFISTVNPQEPGSLFKIEVPLPEPLNSSVQCEAEVVWKRHYTRGGPYEPGMGLRFLDISDEVADSIDEWIKSSLD